MTQQTQINIRLDQSDLEKLDKIVGLLGNFTFKKKASIARKYYKWRYTRQDALVYLIRAFMPPEEKS